jgi:hypothetical protein
MGEVSSWSTTDDSNTDLFPENMPFSDVNDGGRAIQGAIARWFKDINGGLAASGSSNAFTVTSNRTIGSLVNGTRLTFVANHSITGAATLNLNGLGAKDIKRFNGSALASGDIISGQPVDVIYSSALDDWIMVSALAALVGSTHADFGENASPGDPAADTARLYARDDGSGVTELVWRDSSGTVNNLREATQADMEAATSGRFVSPRRQADHPLMPRALGRGAAAGGIVGNSFNVASIVRNDTGDYTVTMTDAMPDVDYLVIACMSAASATVHRSVGAAIVSTTVFTVNVFNDAGSDTDQDFSFVVYAMP